MAQATFFRPSCWKEIPAKAQVCLNCGTSLEGRAGDSFADKLIGALRHPISYQAATAALTLGRLHELRAVEPLLEVFNRTQDPEVVEAAIWALGELRDTRAVSRLVEILDNPGAFLTLRIASSEALGKIGGEEAIQALLQAARSDHRALRVTAQAALKDLAIAHK